MVSVLISRVLSHCLITRVDSELVEREILVKKISFYCVPYPIWFFCVECKAW